jgi:hypothetical protein
MIINSETTLDDILANPSNFGVPTFEQFSQNKDRYMGSKDWILAAVDKGSENLSAYSTEHKYKFKNWNCDSLEEIERVARDEGHELLDLDFKAQLVDITNKRATIVVEFFPKKSSLLIGV